MYPVDRHARSIGVGRDGYPDDELSTGASFGVHSHQAAVQLGDLAGDRQSESGAALTSQTRSVTRPRAAKRQFVIAGVEAGPIVIDARPGEVPQRPGTGADHGAGPAQPHGIADQVRHRALEGTEVSYNDGRPYVDLDREPGRLDRPPMLVERFLDQGPEVHAGPPAAGDLVTTEDDEIVDGSCGAIDRPAHHRSDVFQVLDSWILFSEHDIEVCRHDCQRTVHAADHQADDDN